MTAVSDDEAMRALVARLARPDRSGDLTVERAALLASGADFGAAIVWIHARGGRSEAPPTGTEHGLHGVRRGAGGTAPPLRYILPAGALNAGPPAPSRGRETQ
jgi:hypothetical protein